MSASHPCQSRARPDSEPFTLTVWWSASITSDKNREGWGAAIVPICCAEKVSLLRLRLVSPLRIYLPSVTPLWTVSKPILCLADHARMRRNAAPDLESAVTPPIALRNILERRALQWGPSSLAGRCWP